MLRTAATRICEVVKFYTYKYNVNLNIHFIQEGTVDTLFCSNKNIFYECYSIQYSENKIKTKYRRLIID